MNVLGINDAHNSSAALLRDGELVAACEEERFTGVKNQSGFPIHAISSVLGLSQMTMAEIDVVAAAGRYTANGLVPSSSFSRDEALRRHEDMLTGAMYATRSRARFVAFLC